MGSKPNVAPVGTGQQGAGTEHVDNDTATTPQKRIDRVAEDAASKGLNRERRDDQTEFTK